MIHTKNTEWSVAIFKDFAIRSRDLQGRFKFGGNDENLVKFSKLKNEMTKLQNELNAELTKIASGIATAGGTYTPTQIQIDINESKTELIKIKGQN